MTASHAGRNLPRVPSSRITSARDFDAPASRQLRQKQVRRKPMPPLVFKLKQKVPNASEAKSVGPFKAAIKRDSAAFKKLVRNDNPDVVFKSEESHKEDDHMMTPRLSEKVDALARLVRAEFPGIRLRITEAWDDSTVHASTSRHLEGRAVDLTTSDRDGRKLGRLAGLAVEAGFDWVFFENPLHVHASVKNE
ncbi:MAG: hypothetical protein WCD76_00805 [Pyrinomonadaceae bacterium]